MIITYGEPDLRLKFFTNCVNNDEIDKASITVEKVELSLLSNLINSLRNRSHDGAINSALKDQNTLLNSLIDVYDSKINEIDVDPKTRKKFLCLKILALTKLKKLEKEKKLEKLANEIKNENTLGSVIINDKCEVNIKGDLAIENNKDLDVKNEKVVEEIKEESKEENLSKVENLKEKAIISDEKPNKRRTHCYAYIFKKLDISNK